MGGRKVGLAFGVWVFVLLVAVFGAVLNIWLIEGGETIGIMDHESVNVPITTIQHDGGVGGQQISGAVYEVTLVTGDTVIASDSFKGHRNISIVPADKTKLGQSFQMFESPTGTYVIPSDVSLEKLDIELFNIDYLISEGYHELASLPVIVTMTGEGDQITQSIEGRLRDLDGGAKSLFPRLSAVAARLPLNTISDSVQSLLEQSDVEKIWLDRKMHVSLSESVPLIGAPELWDSGYNGTGIKIAILDTGIDNTHPDLDDLDDNPSTIDPKVVEAIDFTTDFTTKDIFGHGTHCAGIAAGTGAASGGINKGVAPGALLWNVKVLNQYGWGSESWVISGIEYAAYGPDGTAGTGDEADVISMSLAGVPTDGTDPMSKAVNDAVDAGVVVVIAAANDGDYFRIGSPGVASKAITVGASDKYDYLAYFSSRGPTIDFRVKPDVLAPGVSISSSVPYDVFGTYYQLKSGTSMATPHVAGVAALMLEKGVPAGWLAPLYVKDALISTSVDLGYDVYTQGGGRIYAPSAAYTEVLVDPATVSFGLYSEDDSDDATLTFHNLNEASSRDLTLSVMVRDIRTGTLVDCASLDTTALNIAASSSASVTLTINTGVSASIYSGIVTANIDTGEAVHVIFGFSRLNKVTVTKIDMTGAPAANNFVHIIGDPGFPEWTYGLLDEHGTTAFYVTDGTYQIISTRSDYATNADIYTLQENILVTTDTLVYLDERDTKSIDFDENKPDQIMAEKTSSLFYQGTDRWYTFGGGWAYPASALTYISPTSFNTGFTYSYYPEAYYKASEPWTIDTPEWHKLLFTLADITTETTFVADYNILVQRTTDYKVAIRPDVANIAQHAFDPIAYSSGTYVWQMNVPQRRIEWLSPQPATYYEWYEEQYPQFWSFDTPSLSYPPGTESYLALGEHPFSSGAYIEPGAEYFYVAGSISQDTFGNRFRNNARSRGANLTVIQDGIEVFRSEIWDNFWQSFYFSGTPEFKVIIEDNCGLNLSTRTYTELEFRASTMQDCRPPQVTMKPIGSGLWNTVSPGELLVNVTVSDESSVPSVGLEYSLDNGTTWTSAAVVTSDGTHQFSLGMLSSGTYVSLRANATDVMGNSISHTAIRGLYVHGPTTIDDYDGLWHTQDFTVNLLAHDDLFGIAETYYKINNDPVKSVSVDGPPLITTEKTDNTLEYWSINNAGNEEFPHRLLQEIKLDKTQPTGSIIINDGEAYTTSTSVALTLTSADETSGVHQVRYSNDGIWDTEPWETPSPTITWTLTSGDGTKTVYYQIKDGAGMISIMYSGMIVLDTAAPTGSVEINGRSTYTTTTEVELTLSATDPTSGISEMRFSNDNIAYTEWQTYATSKLWNLLGGDGVKTVYVQTRDHAGHISTNSATIILDTTSPIGFILIDGGKTYTNLTSVTLTLSGNCPTSGVSKMRFSSDTVTWSDWESYATSKSWTLPTGDGIKSTTVQYRDNAGLVSSHSDSIILDTKKPTANAGADQTVSEDALVSFDGSASQDANGIQSYTWIFTDVTGQTLTGKYPTYRFTTPGTYVVTLRAEDSAGNSATDTVTITVLLDTDGDGTADTTDLDDDNDGMPDSWETENGLNPLDSADASLDPDGDDVTNLGEYQTGTNPNISDAQATQMWIIVAAITIIIIGIAVGATLLLRRRR